MGISKKGFSLLEVLISLVILSLITVSIINGTKDSHNIKEKVTSEDKDKLKVYSALNMMEWDFSQIYSPLYFSEQFDMKSLSIKTQNTQDPLFQLNEKLQRIVNQKYYNNPLFFAPNKEWIPIPRFKDDKTSFEFFTSSHRRALENSKESTYAWVVYTLEDPTDKDQEYHREIYGEDAPELASNLVKYSVFKDPFRTEDIDFDKIRPQVIMENVTSLEFTFWNDQKGKFTPMKEIGDGKGRVDAIKVMIEYKNLYGNEESIERIFRPVWPQYNLREAEDFGK